MSKAKAEKATPKAEKLKELKATNGQPKKQQTTDEMAESIKRNLIIRYVAIDSENHFLILNADDNNKNLPKEIEKDTFKAPVHKKLLTSVQKLRVHAAILANYIEAAGVKKISDIPAEQFANFNVTSVHFKYGKKGDSIQINCTLKTQRDKAFNFTTPIEYLDSDNENAYEFADDLLKIRNNIFDRIDAYMSGDERGDANSIGMFAPAADDGVPYTEAETK